MVKTELGRLPTDVRDHQGILHERVHQPHERNRATVGGVEDLADVSWSACGEQGRGGIDLMEVILQCPERT